MQYVDSNGNARVVKNKIDILKSIRSLSFSPEKTMAQFKKAYAKRFEEIYGKKLNTKTDETFLNDLIYYGEVKILKTTPTKKLAGVKKKTTVKNYKLL